jgi:hypothetical protein
MLGKLKKHDKCYSLFVKDVEMAMYDIERTERPLYSLSKENCDYIFGVIDVEKLFLETPHTVDNEEDYWKIRAVYITGFNKAMELQKDKLFTVKDVELAIAFGLNGMYGYESGEEGTTKNQMKRFIQSLQPTEIEVEMVMDDIFDGIDSARIFPKEETSIPMLDKDGCLILKKI